MKKHIFYLLSFFVIFNFSFQGELEGAFTFKNGRLVSVDTALLESPEEHFGLGLEASEQKDWKEAVKQFRIVSSNCLDLQIGKDALYFLGVAEFYWEDYDAANEAFSKYIQYDTNPKFFVQAMGYKFRIAEQFRRGAKRHILGSKELPKWGSTDWLAVEIYDEVSEAFPAHELGAKAMMGKALLVEEKKDYKESIEELKKVIKRYPKSSFASDCYERISSLYKKIAEKEQQNSDLIGFALVNLNRFEKDFPTAPSLEKVRQDLSEMKEGYAKSLFDIGQFYEKIHQRGAALVYYQRVIKLFPETNVSLLCRKRLPV